MIICSKMIYEWKSQTPNDLRWFIQLSIYLLQDIACLIKLLSFHQYVRGESTRAIGSEETQVRYLL
jgi:hypothetical protein